MKIVVTGATGFIGGCLIDTLSRSGFDVGAVLRNSGQSRNMLCECVEIGDIGGDVDWSRILDGVDAVVHLAGRAHILKETAANSLREFRRINVKATEHLAYAAGECGVRRFIFMSSIGVNGKAIIDRPFIETDSPHPCTPYAISKWEAEQVLHKISKENGLEIVILRSPLVYGSNAPGNFARLMQVIRSGVPLPLANIKYPRSFVYVENLVDAIMRCMTHPLAGGETFMVSDGKDISTSELIRMIAGAMNRRPMLFPMPEAVLKVLARVVGKSDALQKLTGALTVDSQKIRSLLDWKPPFTLEEGIEKTVQEYKRYETSI